MHLSWWDVLIVAAAWRACCNFLISEYLQNGQTVENLTTIDPFTTSINEPLSLLLVKVFRILEPREHGLLLREPDF